MARTNPVPGLDLFGVGRGQVGQADIGRFPELSHDGVGRDPVESPVGVIVLAILHSARTRLGFLPLNRLGHFVFDCYVSPENL